MYSQCNTLPVGVDAGAGDAGVVVLVGDEVGSGPEYAVAGGVGASAGVADIVAVAVAISCGVAV